MMKAAPPLYVLLILIDDIVQYVSTYHARGIHPIRTHDAHPRIMTIHVHKPLQILLRVLSIVVVVHIAHIGLVHGNGSLAVSPRFAS